MCLCLDITLFLYLLVSGFFFVRRVSATIRLLRTQCQGSRAGIITASVFGLHFCAIRLSIFVVENSPARPKEIADLNAKKRRGGTLYSVVAFCGLLSVLHVKNISKVFAPMVSECKVRYPCYGQGSHFVVPL